MLIWFWYDPLFTTFRSWWCGKSIPPLLRGESLDSTRQSSEKYQYHHPIVFTLYFYPRVGLYCPYLCSPLSSPEGEDPVIKWIRIIKPDYYVSAIGFLEVTNKSYGFLACGGIISKGLSLFLSVTLSRYPPRVTLAVQRSRDSLMGG